MEWIDSLILGVVQGLAEYLPISSSGHLQICRDLLGMEMPGAEALQFDVALHVATVLSTIVVLWHEFLPLVKSFFGFRRDENTTYVFKLLVSAIPIMIVGLLFKDDIENLFTGNLLTVGIALIATSALLSFAYFFRTRPEEESSAAYAGRSKALTRGRDITFVDAFIIGVSQAIAVIPGLSRSGTTIATGLLIGDSRKKVAQFSFFMVIIPILGEALLDIKEILTMPADAAANQSVGILPLIVGFISAFIVGCLACKWMLNIVKKGKLIWFAIYCLIVGAICIIFQ